MEDFELDYEEVEMPYMKASVDIPYNFLEKNFDSVNKSLYEFSDNITDGKLLVRINRDENGVCCFEAKRTVEDENENGEYDLDVAKNEDGLKVIIFKLENASIVKAKHNGLDYLVNLRE